ncbi:MAG: amino acid carrier protein [Planctomycetota bacterium]
MNEKIGILNGVLFSDAVVYALLAAGVLFTLWSGFGQFRALTHGVAVVRGKYDSPDDPGAINHFQALSAALSATVGLGNIAGVAVAVGLGGPGAVFWMWIIGFLGMSLKMTEVTQSMLFRNTSDPDNPHGGPMFVVRDGLRATGAPILGWVFGGVFCVTLLISAITGGNMFQSWNVAEVTTQYFELPILADVPKTAVFDAEKLGIGIVLAITVALVIVGGIKRIGAVAGKIVPLMCGLYLLAGLWVLIQNIGVIPDMLALIVKHGLGLGNADPQGAFIGGAFGYALTWGIKRALFSSEAGQGSAPIAHSAAKCDEPVREGVVAGLEPFIDTIVVCTVTALVILSSGAWNRPAEAEFGVDAQLTIVATETGWTIDSGELPEKTDEAKRITGVPEGEPGWSEGDSVFALIESDPDNPQADTGASVYRLSGIVREITEEPADGGESIVVGYRVEWSEFEGAAEPVLLDRGVYVSYAGAGLTAHAFDRVTPGLGKVLVTVAAWLFALSTMISWSYYGEQGIHYLFGWIGDAAMPVAVLIYKLIYCFLIALSCVGFIRTDEQLDMWTTLGLGVMLVANIPIMIAFGTQAMGAYHEYMSKLGDGEFESHAHTPASIREVVEGKDVESTDDR